METSQRKSNSDMTLSLFQANQSFVDKIMSRDSTLGGSARFSYRLGGVVPFKWEAKAGKPKLDHSPAHEEDDVAVPAIPVSPPPMMALARSNNVTSPASHRRKRHNNTRDWLWNKLKKNRRGKKGNKKKVEDCNGLDEFVPQIQKEFMGSAPLKSSSSWSTTSSNATGSGGPRSSKINSLTRGFASWSPF